MDYSYKSLRTLLRESKAFPRIIIPVHVDISAPFPRNKSQNIDERVLRTLSWLRTAENTEDVNVKLTNTLIAFNALYAQPPEPDGSFKNMMKPFLRKLVACDKTKILRDFLTKEGQEFLNAIMRNRYLPENYWGYMGVHPSPKQHKWEKEFDEENKKVENLLTLLSKSKKMENLLIYLQEHKEVKGALDLIQKKRQQAYMSSCQSRKKAVNKELTSIQQSPQLFDLIQKNKDVENLLVFIQKNKDVENLLAPSQKNKELKSLLTLAQSKGELHRLLALIQRNEEMEKLLALIKKDKEAEKLLALIKKDKEVKDSLALFQKNMQAENLLVFFKKIKEVKNLLTFFKRNKKVENLLTVCQEDRAVKDLDALIEKNKKVNQLLDLIKNDKEVKNALAFIKNDKEVQNALIYTLVHEPLECVLSRITGLRNQMLHGAAGYNDCYNREQVGLCAEFMLPLVWRMLHIVIENPKGWGKVPYPPQGELNEHTLLPVPLEGD